MPDITEAKRLLLADYERERDELNVVISRLRKELGITQDGVGRELERQATATPKASQKVEETVNPGDFYGMSQIGAVKVFLDRRGERNHASLQEIAQALLRGKAIEAVLDAQGMRNLSSNLSKSDEFESVAKGRWGLAKWYGGKKAKRQDSEPEQTKAAATEADAKTE